MMLYLSDPIYIERNFSEISPIGSYISYAVKIRPLGLNPETEETAPFDLIYRGHLYVTGKSQRVYLNDIITPHLYDNTYIKPLISINQYATVTGMVESNFDFPKSIVKVRVEYDNSTIVDEMDVVQFYSKDQEHTTLVPSLETRVSQYAPTIMNFMDYSTDVYPRVPRLTNDTNKFWIGAKIALTPYFWDVSNMDGIPSICWTGYTQEQYPVFISAYVDQENCYSQLAWNITGSDYSKLSRIEGEGIGITAILEDTTNDSYYPSTDSRHMTFIGRFDECPSDFYLIWMDRSGAYQCQPFTKKTYRKENITTTSVVNSIEETRPVLKSITDTWTLHSDWLTFDEYRAYESIFTSPYLYLYDRIKDEGYWVNCTNKTWDEKNERNTNKPFNLTITLESNQPQNIRY